jgi:chitinase
LRSLTGPDGAILTDVSKFALYLDYIELMAYDMYGAWSKTTGPNSPLYTCDANSDSIDAAVKRWVAAVRRRGGIPGLLKVYTTSH